MDIRPLPTTPAAAATRRSLDITVSDGGVDRATPPPTAAPRVAAAAAPPAPVEPTSTETVGQTLSVNEKEALTERFAGLPRTGVTSGVYGPQGRTATLPMAQQQGSLLDITG